MGGIPEPTTTISRASELVPPDRFFGPEQWLQYFPTTPGLTPETLGDAATIPWAEETLSAPCVKARDVRLADHFLFLGVSAVVLPVGRRSISLFAWPEILDSIRPRPPSSRPASGGLLGPFRRQRTVEPLALHAEPAVPSIRDPNRLRTWLRADWATPGPRGWSRPIGAPLVHFSVEPCAFRWHLIPIEVLDGSAGVYDLSQVHQPMEYQFATAIEVVTAALLYHLLNGRYPAMADQVARSSSWANGTGAICAWADQGELAIGLRPSAEPPGVVLSRTPFG